MVWKMFQSNPVPQYTIEELELRYKQNEIEIAKLKSSKNRKSGISEDDVNVFIKEADEYQSKFKGTKNYDTRIHNSLKDKDKYK